MTFRALSRMPRQRQDNMTDTCPICSIQSETCALNSRYSGLICAECLKKPMQSLCGGRIEFGNASASGGFVSLIDDKKTDPPQHFFDLVLDDQMVLCYADEHRFGGIVYNVATTRTREEARQMIREAKAKAAAEEPQRSQRRRQWARELQGLNEMYAARYARGCAGGQRQEEADTAKASPAKSGSVGGRRRTTPAPPHYTHAEALFVGCPIALELEGQRREAREAKLMAEAWGSVGKGGGGR